MYRKNQIQMEWPSSEDISELKEQGITPWSRLATRAASLSMFGLLLLFLPESLTRLKADFQQSLITKVPSNHILQQFSLSAQEILKYGAISCAALIFCILLTGILQTRFLFKLSLLSPSGENFLKKRKTQNTLFSVACDYILLALIATCTWIFLGHKLFSILFMVDFSQGAFEITINLIKMLGMFFLILGGLLFPVFWICSELKFRWNHRA